jgi:Phage P2 baseplate assembly protein gpV
MSYIGDELRILRREIVRLNRKLAKQKLPGKVVARGKGKVTLDLGEDPETGKKLMSPEVRVQSISAGKFKFFVLPSIGEQMYLESASGVIGADSIATFGCFDNDNPQPEMEDDEMLLMAGQTRLSIKDGQLKISVGETSLTLTPEGLSATAQNYEFD